MASVDLVAMRDEVCAQLRAQIPTVRVVEPVEDIEDDVLEDVAQRIVTEGEPFILVRFGDESPAKDQPDDGYLEPDSQAQLLEHELTIILGTPSRLSRDAAVRSALTIKQQIKDVLRTWAPAEVFANRKPVFHGSNRIGRPKSIRWCVLHGVYFTLTVYES
jgi:hypothetical protein